LLSCVIFTTRRSQVFLIFIFLPDVGEFQLIDKKVLEALLKIDDYYPYIRGLIANCGFKRFGIEYAWQRREKGTSKARFFDLLDQSINGLISFSHLPLRLCVFAGMGIAFLTFLYAVFGLVINIVFYRQIAPPGIPTLIVALFFFSGVQLFFLGILGEYIGAVHSQVRKRPLVIEREKINL